MNDTILKSYGGVVAKVEIKNQGAAGIAPWFSPCSNPNHTIYTVFNLYYWDCNEKRTKINKKDAGIGPFLKKKIKNAPKCNSFFVAAAVGSLFFLVIDIWINRLLVGWPDLPDMIANFYQELSTKKHGATYPPIYRYKRKWGACIA